MVSFDFRFRLQDKPKLFLFSSNHNNQFVTQVNLTRKKIRFCNKLAKNCIYVLMLDDDQPESEKQRMDPDHCNVLVRTTVCPPVAESPPRKFGPLFSGRHSGPSWSDFWRHLLMQQYNIFQRKSSLIYCS